MHENREKERMTAKSASRSSHLASNNRAVMLSHTFQITLFPSYVPHRA